VAINRVADPFYKPPPSPPGEEKKEEKGKRLSNWKLK